MDNSSNTYSPYKKELLLVSKSFAVSIRTTAIFFYYIMKITSSDAESCEEQDGSKHKFVGGMAAKIWPNLRQGVAKNTEEK